MSTDGLELDGGLDVPAGWNFSVFPVESQDSMSAPVLEIDKDADGQHGGGGPRARCRPMVSSSTGMNLIRAGALPGRRGCSGSVLPLESQDSMSAAIVGGGADGKEQPCGYAARYEVCSQATTGWTRRVKFH